MKFLITAEFADGLRVTYPGIGSRDALQDAAYDAGALGVSIMAAE